MLLKQGIEETVYYRKKSFVMTLPIDFISYCFNVFFFTLYVQNSVRIV